MNSKYIFSTYLLISVISVGVAAQNTLEYKPLGISITIPTGFQYQEGDGFLLMADPGTPTNFYYLFTHDYENIGQLKQAANEPYMDDQGTYLVRSDDLEEVDEHTVGAFFSGNAGGTNAQAYILGKVNVFGPGVSIFGISAGHTQNLQQLRTIVLDINAGISFSEREIQPVVDEWKQRLMDTQLIYRSNYSSNDYTDGGANIYANSSETFDLCAAGYFNYSGSSNISGGTNSGAVSGFGDSSSRGNGTWKIDVDASGNPLLKLHYNNGNQQEYTLFYEDGYLYMNNNKFTIGRGAEYGPSCY